MTEQYEACPTCGSRCRVGGKPGNGTTRYFISVDLERLSAEIKRLREALEHIEAGVEHNDFAGDRLSLCVYAHDVLTETYGQERLITWEDKKPDWAQEHIRRLVENNVLLETLLGKLVDPHPCKYDKQGNCLEHGYFGEGECPHDRANRYFMEKYDP